MAEDVRDVDGPAGPGRASSRSVKQREVERGGVGRLKPADGSRKRASGPRTSRLNSRRPKHSASSSPRIPNVGERDRESMRWMGIVEERRAPQSVQAPTAAAENVSGDFHHATKANLPEPSTLSLV